MIEEKSYLLHFNLFVLLFNLFLKKKDLFAFFKFAFIILDDTFRIEWLTLVVTYDFVAWKVKTSGLGQLIKFFNMSNISNVVLEWLISAD